MFSNSKCIIVLSKLNDGELNLLIDNLNKNFIDNNKDVDLLIFYELQEKKLIDTIISYQGGKTIYHEVENFKNSETHSRYKKEIPESVYDFCVGYRSMCRFYAGELFKILKTYNYKYCLRLDTDSKFLTSTRNIFDEFINNNSKYGYISILNEPEELCYSLNKEIADYIIKNNIKTELPIVDFLNRDYNLAYLNNFEMFNVETFCSDQYIKLYEYLDSNINGFLRYRWGDHILRFLYVNLFLKKDEIHYFSGLDYFHGWKNWRNSPFELIDWKVNNKRLNPVN